MPEPWGLGAEFRDELLNCEIFYTLKEAQVLIEQWRIHYNTVRPRRSAITPIWSASDPAYRSSS